MSETFTMLTPLEEIESMTEGGQIHALEQNISHVVREKNKNEIILGGFLFYAEQNDIWDKENYTSFYQWLLQPGISISKSTAYKVKRNFAIFVDQFNIEQKLLIDAGSTKLDILAKNVELNKDNVIDFVVKARETSKRDLLAEVGAITVNEDGYIESELKKDDAGHILHVYHGNDDLPPGKYRLVETNGNFGDADVVCHLKGKIQN